MNTNDQKLSLNDETFKALKEDFDSILGRTLGNMEMKGAEESTITLKLGISFERSSIGTRPITRPTFKHDISSVMQVKDKKSGSLSGDYELVYDEDTGSWVVRKIDNGQSTLFDDEDRVIDADYTVVDDQEEHSTSDSPALPEGSKGLPEKAIGGDSKQEESDGSEDTSEAGNDIPDATREFQEGSEAQYDVETPYGWLRQFAGKKMRITKARSNYVVRTEDNRIVLSSSAGPDNAFYCSAERLAPHVDHDVRCFLGTDDSDREYVYIQCLDCKSVLYLMYAPEVETGPDPDDTYDYDDPEAE